MKFYDFKRLVIGIVYPNACPFCEEKIRYNEFLCKDCEKKISPPPEDTPIALTDFVCVTTYDSFTDKAVFSLKNGTILSAASVMAHYLSEKLDASEFDVVTAVPLHPHDKKLRGFNQSELIAKELSQMLGKPYRRLLQKIRRTKPQKALKYSERIVNMDGAFAAKKPQKVASKRVLLIDDVCTTGSTLSECEYILRKAGASTVKCACFAKTILRHKEKEDCQTSEQ